MIICYLGAVEAPTTITSADGELYFISTQKNGSLNVRPSAGSGGSLGKIYKNAVVAVTQYGSDWCRITYCTATSYDKNSRKWNYDKRTGYVPTEYLTRVGTEVPDYTGQVDMGSSLSTKVNGNNLYVTPVVTVSNIKAQYPDAIIKRADGTDISGTADLVGTGAKITTGGKTYTIVKLGDVNGDATVDVIDLALVKRYLMGNATLVNEYLQAGILQGGNTDIDVVDLALLKRQLTGAINITV